MEIQNFKVVRESLGLSQQDVAVMLGVSRMTYIKWEQEPETMPLGKYIKLLKELERLNELSQ